MKNREVYRRQLNQAVKYLQRQFKSPPNIAIFFGSGLGGEFCRQMGSPDKSVRYSQVPYFHLPTVAGHDGKLLYFAKTKKEKSVLAIQGRNHLYEGLSPYEVVFPLRALALWGVSQIILTNAAGGMNPKLKMGDLVLIQDHLNFTGSNPLIGPNLDFLGPRFPTVSETYQNHFSLLVFKTAKKLKLPLKKGVYVGVMGPSYETLAEIKAFRKLGGDVIGMSTVHEVIAAAHAGISLAVLSAVVNSSSEVEQGLTHAKVLHAAKKIDQDLAKLIIQVVKDG